MFTTFQPKLMFPGVPSACILPEVSTMCSTEVGSLQFYNIKTKLVIFSGDKRPSLLNNIATGKDKKNLKGLTGEKERENIILLCNLFLPLSYFQFRRHNT